MRNMILGLIALNLCIFHGEQTYADDVAYEPEIIDLSERYFQNILSGKIDAAYKNIASSLKQYSTKEQWGKTKEEFTNIIGEMSSISISSVTVYVNPENAPRPGIYVAADYYNIYSKVPIHCGYLVWYKSDSENSEFQIVREETGYVTKEQLLDIPQDQLLAIKQGLRCISP